MRTMLFVFVLGVVVLLAPLSSWSQIDRVSPAIGSKGSSSGQNRAPDRPLVKYQWDLVLDQKNIQSGGARISRKSHGGPTSYSLVLAGKQLKAVTIRYNGERVRVLDDTRICRLHS